MNLDKNILTVAEQCYKEIYADDCNFWKYFVLDSKSSVKQEIETKITEIGYSIDSLQAQIKCVSRLTDSQLIELAIQDEELFPIMANFLKLRSSKSLYKAVQVLLWNEDSKQRLLATKVISGQLGSAYKLDLTNSLSAKLKNESDDNVVAGIIQALQNLECESVAFDFESFIESSNKSVRWSIARYLADKTDARSIGLLEILANDVDNATKIEALTSLRLIAEDYKDDIECDLLEKLKNIFGNHLNETEFQVRIEAILGLSYLKDSRILEHLLVELNKSSYGDYRIEAARALGHSSLLPTLEKLCGKNLCDERLLAEAIQNCSIDKN